MKYLLCFLVLLSFCPIAKADLVIRIGTETDKFQAVLNNPSDSEVVRLQAIQAQQLLIELATKGCNKKTLREKLLGK